MRAAADASAAMRRVEVLWAMRNDSAEWPQDFTKAVLELPPSVGYRLLARLWRQTGDVFVFPGRAPFSIGFHMVWLSAFFKLLVAAPPEAVDELVAFYAFAEERVGAEMAGAAVPDPPALSDAAVATVLSWARPFVHGRDSYTPPAGPVVGALRRARPDLAASVDAFIDDAAAEYSRRRQAEIAAALAEARRVLATPATTTAWAESLLAQVEKVPDAEGLRVVAEIRQSERSAFRAAVAARKSIPLARLLWAWEFERYATRDELLAYLIEDHRSSGDRGAPAALGDRAARDLLAWTRERMVEAPGRPLSLERLASMSPELARGVARLEVDVSRVRRRRAVLRLTRETVWEAPVFFLVAAATAAATWVAEALAGDLALLVPPLGLLPVVWSYNRIVERTRPSTVMRRLPWTVAAGLGVAMSVVEASAIAGFVVAIGAWIPWSAPLLASIAFATALRIALAARDFSRMRLRPRWWMPDPDKIGQ